MSVHLRFNAAHRCGQSFTKLGQPRVINLVAKRGPLMDRVLQPVYRRTGARASPINCALALPSSAIPELAKRGGQNISRHTQGFTSTLHNLLSKKKDFTRLWTGAVPQLPFWPAHSVLP